jgi:hypothetical protein
MLNAMAHRVGRKGQVVIPSQEGDAIRVQRVVSPDALMGSLSGRRLIERLEKDRQLERRR